MKTFAVLAAVFVAFVGLRADTIVQWNFNNTVNQALPSSGAVSYTHLTLPTKA